jgi:polysaccharide biosynthesis protein PslH
MSTIVVLTSRFPFPLEKGDKLRIFNQVKGLSGKNEVHLVALDERKVLESQLEALRPYCKSISVFRIGKARQAINLFRTLFQPLPLQVGLFYSDSIHASITSLLSEIKPAAIHCHLIRMSEYIRKEKKFRKTIDYMDAFSIGMKRRMQISHPLLKPVFAMEYSRLLKYERSVFDDIENKTIISIPDREAIQHPDKKKIHIVQNGVDFGIYFPAVTKKKYDLLFTGNMGYPPNIESAYYAATEILPRIHESHPEITLLIAGVNPPSKIKKLASERVFVIDKFDHIRDAFAQSRIMLAPMLISIGLQNKILQAMAMKVPSVVSSLANSAIAATHKVEIIEANTPGEFAYESLALLKNSEAYAAVQENAYRFVRKNFDWKTQNDKLEKIILG